MKTLNAFIVVLFTSFVTTPSFADIHFVFKHNPSPVNANLPSSLLPTLYISAKKENGAHLAESESSRNQRNEMYPGESSEDSVRSSFFASDPTGTYQITINCYLRQDKQMKSMESFTKKISLPKNEGTVTIEAECPVISKDSNSAYYIAPPKNIIIKVDGNYIIGGLKTQEGSN